jgi:hypothetical protein
MFGRIACPGCFESGQEELLALEIHFAEQGDARSISLARC